MPGALHPVRVRAGRPLRHEILGPRAKQIPPDLVVKSQPTDIVDIVLQLIRRPNGAHRACHSRKSRGEPFSPSEVQWSTTKSDGVWPSPLLKQASIRGSATLCSSRWTQWRGRQLHRLQYRREHGARLLPEKALRSRRSVRPREEKVVNRGEALPLARQIEAS